VGASSDETGNIKYGGDWTMESTGQDIELIYFTQSIEYYTYLLDNPAPWVSSSQFSGWLSPWGLATDGAYMYVSCSGSWGTHNGTIQKISLATNPPAAPTRWISSLRNNCAIIINGGFMYIAIAFSGSVIRVDLTTAGQTTWISGLNVPVGLVIDSGYIYVSCHGNGSIIKSDLTTRVGTTWATGLSSPNSLVTHAGYLYVANGGTGSIIKFDLITSSRTTLVSGLNNPTGLVIDFDYLYVSARGSGIITRINLTNTSTAEIFYSSSNPVLDFTGLAIFQNYLYAVASSGVFRFGINYICFKSDSKILTDKGYIPIQELRKGDLVKTSLHDYKAINIICKSVIYHSACKERIKDQLYKCSKDNFDEIFEPLIITGSHSILVDDFTSKEQREKTNKVLGDIFITDDKYRLPACADERTTVYEIPGNYTVYHMALENDEYYENYGIFANGLLVETCSKRYLKELSNMTLIQ